MYRYEIVMYVADVYSVCIYVVAMMVHAVCV
jgi:hypothetical protein